MIRCVHTTVPCCLRALWQQPSVTFAHKPSRQMDVLGSTPEWRHPGAGDLSLNFHRFFIDFALNLHFALTTNLGEPSM